MDKYEEALEKARAGKSLEEIFPELAESEDEKIRKSLVGYFSLFKPTDMWDNLFSFSQIVAYLEKQKDKRELDFAEGKVEGVKQTCQEIKDAMSLFEPKDLTPFEFTFRDYIDSAIRYCLSGEGYQQYIKEWAADLLNLEKQEALPTNEEMLRALRVEYEKGVADTIAKYEQKEQESVEWSEKDKDYYDAIIAKLEVTQDDAMLTDNQMDFLKSLPERLNL